MHKIKDITFKLFRNRFFWQLTLAVFMIVMAIYFIKHERLELVQIRLQLVESNPLYIIIGILLTGLYIVFQGQMYVHSFRALGTHIALSKAISLFLKRNLVSIFLPAGGFSSLAFFTSEVEEQSVKRSQIHLASALFAFCGILSVVLIAIPILGVSILYYDLRQAELAGFAFLILLTGFIVYAAWSITKKGLVYQWIVRRLPSVALVLDEMISNEIDRKQFWLTLLVSVGIEFIGIAHLYVSMLALSLDPSWPAAFIGYIVMVILLIASPFLRGFGAIEISLTYILSQFGYPILAAATLTVLFRFFEFWLPLFGGLISFITRKDGLVLRLLPACIILALGLVNIISAITPALPARLALVHDLLPAQLAETSNFLILVFGLLLVILSVFLLRGSKRAWFIGLFLTGLSLIGHLLKAADYEEALLAMVACMALLYTRRNYKLKPNHKLTKISYQILIFSLVIVLAYGTIGFYFIDKKHFGINFEFWMSIKTVLKLFFLFDNNLTPLTPFGQQFLYSIYLAGALVFSFIFYSLLRPYFNTPYNSEEDQRDAKELVKRYGKSALDFFKTYNDKLFFFSVDRQAFISFKVYRHLVFVLEDPVCKDEKAFIEIVNSFDAFCIENGFICTYYRIPEKSIELYKRLKKKILPIGEEAILDLTTFSLEGSKLKTTRSAINRLSAEGFVVKFYQPPIQEGLLQKLEHVSTVWLNELQQCEVTFTQGVFDKAILKEQTIITIEEKEEKVYAFLNIVPDFAAGEATYDLIRKTTDAPNGVLDMLLAKTFLYLKEQGYKSVNMGLAPLSGIEGINVAERTIKFAYDNLKAFGHFKGLRKYKEKYFPRWEKKYLAYAHNYHLLQVPNALKRISEDI